MLLRNLYFDLVHCRLLLTIFFDKFLHTIVALTLASLADSAAFALMANVQIALTLIFLRLFSLILCRVLRAFGTGSTIGRVLQQLALLLLLKDVD